MITRTDSLKQGDVTPNRSLGREHRDTSHQLRARPALPRTGQGGSDAPHLAAGSETGAPLKPARFFACGEDWAYYFLGAKLLLWLVLLATTFVAPAAVTGVGPIRITVDDLNRALPFYTEVLPFQQVAVYEERGPAFEKLTSIAGAHTRVATLQIGDEQIELVDWLNAEGRPLPSDSRSFDHWFQHIAIVVSDMDRAYEHLRLHKVKHVSTAPQTLPDWNPNAGGIRAFYFRDPEDHVLEIIWFPVGKGDPKWRRARAAGPEAGAPLFLGIDHTAIVVNDTERSLTFYRDQFGLKVAGTSENHGIEQERLNQVFGARLLITGLRAPKGPGIEFLEYITPPGGRPIPADRHANDLSFWTVRLQDDGLAESRLIADPDGHSLLLSPIKPASRIAHAAD